MLFEPGLTSSDMKDGMVATMDHITIARGHVAGWSWGGLVALELRLRHADRLVILALHLIHAGEAPATRLSPVHEQ